MVELAEKDFKTTLYLCSRIFKMKMYVRRELEGVKENRLELLGLKIGP